MEARNEKLNAITGWATQNEDIRAVLLTSSLVNPLALVDDLSDLDVELVLEDNSGYISDNSWVRRFGNPIALMEEGEDGFDGKHAITMVLYEDGVKVDFKLYRKAAFLEEIQQATLPADWDIGYKVLLDKDDLTRGMKAPSYQASVIKKPTETAFKKLLNDFWWDAVYVAKCLVRQDLFYAKYLSEAIIRAQYLTPLLEWHIGSRHEWRVTTNKHGRLFRKYLSEGMWEKVERTFSGTDIAENWRALFAMTDLVAETSCELAQKLGYDYPEKPAADIKTYLNDLRARSAG